MHITFAAVEGFSFEIKAGIKQGCPASGSLFALALDPFLRMMLLRIPMRLSTVVAFADDLAAVLFQLHRSLRVLYQLFNLLLRATGLAINPRKTVIVPLGSSTLFTVKRYVLENLPAWAAFRIDDCGKLLGVWIGPGSMEKRWRDATAKFSDRARDSKATHFAIEETIRHYRVHALSVLSHLCQFSAVPPETLMAEDNALQGLTRGPHGVFPRGSLASLKNLGFRFEAPDLGCINRAAMLRTALGSDQFSKILAKWDADVNDENALLVPKHLPWFEASCIHGLMTMCKHHTLSSRGSTTVAARSCRRSLLRKCGLR
jgi:hypothetical protein